MITVTYIRIMKKVLLAAMILLAGASFTSCSSSDDDGQILEQRSKTTRFTTITLSEYGEAATTTSFHSRLTSTTLLLSQTSFLMKDITASKGTRLP